MENELRHQEKHELRQRTLALLRAMDADARAVNSAAICRRVAESPAFASAKTVLLYIPTPEEVDVRPLFRSALAAGKACAAPRMDWELRGMWAVMVPEANFATEVRRHGLHEPLESVPAPLEAIDLVVTPGVAFDRSGGRLGRGAGYYDRFLVDWRARRQEAGRTAGTALGVCFAAQLLEVVPREAHDVLLDGVAWEDGLVMCPPAGSRADRS